MRIEQFNDLGDSEAAALLRSCVDVDSWVATLLAARPYSSVTELKDCARTQTTLWTGAEVEAALADHPRIGERHPGGDSADMSRREQAALATVAVAAADADADADAEAAADDPAAEALRARLVAGNRAYEERFGRIFLVRAAGRSAAEILSLLDERLGHDPDTELAVTAEQLAEIALLRLEGLLR